MLESINSQITSLGVKLFSKGADYIVSPVIALGTNCGTLQIINLRSNEVESEFLIAKQALRCVRWLNRFMILSFSIDELAGGDSGCWRNYVYLTDIRNGVTKNIRDDKGIEVTCIRNIKVSPSRCYFALLLRDHPLEIWDARTLTLVRTVKVNNDNRIDGSLSSPIFYHFPFPSFPYPLFAS